MRSNDSELLLNLVRLRYKDSMLFLGVGGVVAQYAYDASLNAGGQAGGGTVSATFGTTLDYGEKPTITYTPLTGEEFAQRLLAPIPLESVMLFAVPQTAATVGFGDVVLRPGWRVLAGVEGLTGIILVGWSTAFVFAVVHRMYEHWLQVHDAP